MKNPKTSPELNYPLREGLTVTISGPLCCGKTTAQLIIMRALEDAGYVVRGNDSGVKLSRVWEPMTGKRVKVNVITKVERTLK